MSEIIMSVENLTKKFPVSGGKFLTACDDITFHVRRGETGGRAMSEIIMSVENLTKKFPVSCGKFLTACDGITFHVRSGETVGIVGESGCGKFSRVVRRNWRARYV